MTFQFNEQQLSELQTFFQKIDHDQDQRISFKDLEEIYAFLGKSRGSLSSIPLWTAI